MHVQEKELCVKLVIYKDCYLQRLQRFKYSDTSANEDNPFRNHIR